MKVFLEHVTHITQEELDIPYSVRIQERWGALVQSERIAEFSTLKEVRYALKQGHRVIFDNACQLTEKEIKELRSIKKARSNLKLKWPRLTREERKMRKHFCQLGEAAEAAEQLRAGDNTKQLTHNEKPKQLAPQGKWEP